MGIASSEQLRQKKCLPCEGGIPRLSSEEARQYLEKVPGWQMTEDGERIRREWRVKNFMAGIQFFERVAEIAEEQGHHPDLHLESYRNVRIEIYTHAIGGLSENDFILAAKIDAVPVEEKK